MARKAKPKLSLREQEDAVILKYINGEPLTLEETALAMWMYDGRKTKKPMTRMGMLKMEQRIMLKLRKACDKVGITIDDLGIFNKNGRTCAESRYGAVSVDEIE